MIDPCLSPFGSLKCVDVLFPILICSVAVVYVLIIASSSLSVMPILCSFVQRGFLLIRLYALFISTCMEYMGLFSFLALSMMIFIVSVASVTELCFSEPICRCGMFFVAMCLMRLSSIFSHSLNSTDSRVIGL